MSKTAHLLGRGPGEASVNYLLSPGCSRSVLHANFCRCLFLYLSQNTPSHPHPAHSCLIELNSSISSSKKVSMSLSSHSPRCGFPHSILCSSPFEQPRQAALWDHLHWSSLPRDLKYHKRHGTCVEISLHVLRHWDCRGCLVLQHILVWPNWYTARTSGVEVGRETQFFSAGKDKSHADFFRPCFQSTGESRSEKRGPTERGRDGESTLISRSPWFWGPIGLASHSDHEPNNLRDYYITQSNCYAQSSRKALEAERIKLEQISKTLPSDREVIYL